MSKSTITADITKEAPPSRREWDVAIHGTLFIVGTDANGQTGTSYVRLDGTTIANGGKCVVKLADDCELVIQMRRPTKSDWTSGV